MNDMEGTNKNSDTSSDAGYKVFYGSNLEELKLLATAYMQEKSEEAKAQIERPAIRFASYFKGLILPIVLYVFITVWLVLCKDSMSVWFFISAYTLVFIFTVKHFVILAVLLYQKFAPIGIRQSCLFEPTCSNYMLLAIEKYGFIIGFCKGIARLCRCHAPNGGIDYP